jgi:gamma-glutamylputrescine oxidase
MNAGKRVILLEKNICGGSSSGRSSGFITPDSELELNQLIRRYGKERARTVWGMATTGVSLIADTIKRYKISCDMQEQDSLFLGLGKDGIAAVKEEADARKKLGYSYTVYSERTLKNVNMGKGYTAGISYTGSFGIISLLYAQELKKVLIEKGVQVFEGTEMLSLQGTRAHTHLGTVNAKDVILCIDKMTPDLHERARDVFHAQTFLAISEPLSASDVRALFPKKPFMCWDSKLVYTYYRLTGDNRLLVGGGSPLTTYYPTYLNSSFIIKGVINDLKKQFPKLDHVQFIQYWPGLIDITKDLMPIVDSDARKRVQVVIGCPGLPWAAFCGDYAARRITDPKCPDYSPFLGAKREFFISSGLQSFLGKTVSFALNNVYSKYKQKDKTG